MGHKEEEKMKKKGFTGRLAAVAAVLCLVTMSLTSGTLARYASEASGDAVATVAKWNITFGADGTYDGSEAIKLSDTINSTANLVAADRIAPGTSGSFALALKGNDTEVAYKYTIELDLSATGAAGVPLAFYKDNGSGAKGDPIDKSSGKVTLEGEVKTNAGSKDVTETIHWEWDTTGITKEGITVDGTTTEEDKNKVDTALGKEFKDFTIPVTIKAEQMLSTD